MSRKATADAAREFAEDILDADYLATLRARAIAGELPPQVEVLLLHYRYGKPPEQILVTQEDDLSNLSDAELSALLTKLQAQLGGNERMNEETSSAIH